LDGGGDRLVDEGACDSTAVTACRAEEPFTRATSVTTVIATRDIERSGFRTINDDQIPPSTKSSASRSFAGLRSAWSQPGHSTVEALLILDLR
jgi:hypothetical protein